MRGGFTITAAIRFATSSLSQFEKAPACVMNRTTAIRDTRRSRQHDERSNPL